MLVVHKVRDVDVHVQGAGPRRVTADVAEDPGGDGRFGKPSAGGGWVFS